MLQLVLKWLGSLGGGEAIGATVGTFAAAVVAVVWPIVRAVRKQRKLDMDLADRPSVSALPALPAATDRLVQLEVQVRMSEWTLEQARARVKQAEQTVKDLGADLARTAQALVGERYARERAEEALAAAKRALEASDRRGSAMADELTELKRQIEGGHSGLMGIITPLRPGKP